MKHDTLINIYSTSTSAISDTLSMYPSQIMPVLNPTHIYEDLRTGLFSFTDKIFERASKPSNPGWPSSTAPPSGSPQLLRLCRGLAHADELLQKLSLKWHDLQENKKKKLRKEWQDGLRRLKDELETSCTCVGGHSECDRCRNLVSDVLEGLDDLAYDVASELDEEEPKPVANAKEVIQAPEYEPDPTLIKELESAKLDRDKALEELDIAKQDREKALQEIETAKQDMEKALQEIETAKQDKEKLLEEIETAKQDMEKALQEIETSKQDKEKTLEEIETAKQDMEKALQEIETLKQDKENALQEIETLKQDKEKAFQELEDATRTIEVCADILEEAKQWIAAADAYEELHKMKEAKLNRQGDGAGNEMVKKTLKENSVRFKYKQLSALLRDEQYPAADLLTIAEQVLKLAGCKAGFGQEEHFLLPVVETQKIHEAYCDALRRNKSYESAEEEYVRVWYTENYWGSKDRNNEWRYETAYRIGLVMAEQKKYEEAVIWHKKVVDWGVGTNTHKVNKAARSGFYLAKGNSRIKLNDDLVEWLERIWNAPGADHHNNNMLVCGYELGRCLMVPFDRRRAEKAELILTRVWKEWKSRKPKEAWDTAELLVRIYSCLDEKVKELEELYVWMLEKLPDNKTSERIKYQYALALLRYDLGSSEAEADLRKAHKGLLDDDRFGKDNIDTLQSGLLLGQVLMKKNEVVEAGEFFKAAWEIRKDKKYRNTAIIVMAGEFYSDVLIQTGKQNDLESAEKILEELWKRALGKQMLNSEEIPKEKDSELWHPLLSASHSYGKFLYEKRNNLSLAENVLAKVKKLKIDLGFGESEIEETEELLEEVKRLLVEEEYKKNPLPPAGPGKKDGEKMTLSGPGTPVLGPIPLPPLRPPPRKPRPKPQKDSHVRKAIGNWMVGSFQPR
jgi:tetratricopeptide (TPR) repeat protein